MNPIDIYEYKATPATVDFTRHLSVISLIKILLETAELHANKRGFGFDDMIAKNKSWVLSRFRIDILKLPKVNQNVFVETWPYSVEKLTSERRFNFSDENENLFGSASSQWFQIDFTKRRPISLENEKQFIQVVENKYCVSESPSKITEPECAPVFVKNFNVTYSDIDINGHLTTYKYVEKIMDMFEVSFYENRTIKTFEINFSKEILQGQNVEINLFKIDETNFYCSVNSQNSICAKSRIVWN